MLLPFACWLLAKLVSVIHFCLYGFFLFSPWNYLLLSAEIFGRDADPADGAARLCISG